MASYGYHLTTKNNFYGIKKNGLMPKLGRRSYYIGEKSKLLCFIPDSKYIDYWEEKLYKYFFLDNNMPFDCEVVILKFVIDDIGYVKRSDAECITENVVQADKIMVIPIENPNVEYRLADLDIELNIDESKLKSILETKELFKNIVYTDPILFTSSITKDGRLILDKDLVNRLKYKINTRYEDIIWKNDLIEKVNDIFYTIIESNILYKYDVSEEWLLELLLKTEYEGQQEFYSQLLNCCHIDENRYYLVPTDITNEMLRDHENFICNDFSKISLAKKIKYTETIVKIINEIKKQNRNNNLVYLKKIAK